MAGIPSDLLFSQGDAAALGSSHGLALMPDGERALTASNDWYVRQWNRAAASSANWPKLDGRVWDVSISADGRLFGTSTSVLTLWDVAGSRPLRTIGDFFRRPAPGALLARRCAAALRHVGLVRLHAVSDGRQVREWRGHRGRIVAMDWSSDGLLALSCGDDQAVRIWDFASAGRSRELQVQAEIALRSLRTKRVDAASLAAMGRWYAARGAWRPAAEMLHLAADSQAPVDAIEMARCDWIAGIAMKPCGNFLPLPKLVSRRLCDPRRLHAMLHRVDPPQNKLGMRLVEGEGEQTTAIASFSINGFPCCFPDSGCLA